MGLPFLARGNVGQASAPGAGLRTGLVGAVELSVAALGTGGKELALLEAQHVPALGALVAGLLGCFLEGGKLFGSHDDAISSAIQTPRRRRADAMRVQGMRMATSSENVLSLGVGAVSTAVTT